MDSLTAFLKKKNSGKKIEWKKAKSEWKKNINILYENIRDWLSDAANNNLLEIQEKTIQLSEEHLGQYKVPCLTIKTSGDTVSINPVGRLIIGAQGRFDIGSVKGRVIFLYLSKEKGWI